MIQVTDQHMFWFLVSEARNALNRDNHLSSTAVDVIKEYLPKIEKGYAQITANMIYAEVAAATRSRNLNYPHIFDDLLKFLKDYIGDNIHE